MLVGAALGHQREHLALALGELVERARSRRPAEQPRHDRRVEHALALGDPAQRVGQHGDVGDALLEQVADAARDGPRAGAWRSATRGSATGPGRRRGVAVADLLRGDEALVGMRRRHLDVDDGDVRRVELRPRASARRRRRPCRRPRSRLRRAAGRGLRAAGPRRRRSRPAWELRSDRACRRRVDRRASPSSAPTRSSSSTRSARGPSSVSIDHEPAVPRAARDTQLSCRSRFGRTRPRRSRRPPRRRGEALRAAAARADPAPARSRRVPPVRRQGPRR